MIIEPKIIFAPAYDGKGYWRDYRDREHRRAWAVDFTPTYSRTRHKHHLLNAAKFRLTWFFPDPGPANIGMVTTQFLRRAAKEKMVVLYVHRKIPPMTDGEIRDLEIFNEKLEIEKQELKDQLGN